MYADDNYKCNINIKNGIDENTISKEAYGIVLLLYLTYISKNEEENEEIKQIILNNKEWDWLLLVYVLF